MGEWAVRHSPTPPCRLSLANHIIISREMFQTHEDPGPATGAGKWKWKSTDVSHTFGPYPGVNALLRLAPGHHQDVTEHREWTRSTWKAAPAQTPCNVRAQMLKHQSHIWCIHCFNMICLVVSLDKLLLVTAFNNWLQRFWTLAVIKGPYWLLLPWLKPWMPCHYTMLLTLRLEEPWQLIQLWDLVASITHNKRTKTTPFE